MVNPDTVRGSRRLIVVKEFVVYTGLRILLFLATLAVVLGAWVLAADEANVFLSVIIAFVVSGIGSYFLLEHQRSAFATRVEARAERAAAAFEERRAREDVE
jgi:hypothetical protein